MTDHMWISIDEEEVPDGCNIIEVMYQDGTIKKMCSCDYYWDVYNKKELPVFYREGIE